MQNGIVYEGYWQDELFHGSGRLTLKNGTVLISNFFEGKTATTGTLRYKDGSVYVGSLAYQFMGQVN